MLTLTCSQYFMRYNKMRSLGLHTQLFLTGFRMLVRLLVYRPEPAVLRNVCVLKLEHRSHLMKFNLKDFGFGTKVTKCSQRESSYVTVPKGHFVSGLRLLYLIKFTKRTDTKFTLCTFCFRHCIQDTSCCLVHSRTEPRACS